MASVKLHRCKYTWAKFNGHPCWRLEKALRSADIDYEVVKYGRRSQRAEVERLTGERLVPVIEFENGTAYREETDDMVATVQAGSLFDKAWS